MFPLALWLLSFVICHGRRVAMDLVVDEDDPSETTALQEYCDKFGGSEYGSKSLVMGSSCACATGERMGCIRGDGKLGCGKNRAELNKFTLQEVQENLNPRCVPDPCVAKGGTIQEGPPDGSDKSWMCQCGTGRFCFDDDDQPCPSMSALDRETQFYPDCRDCECRTAFKAPKVNKQKLFSQTCTQTSGGEYISAQCKCDGWNRKEGVCIGTDGKIGGEGCANVNHFIEEGCVDEGGSLKCPTCGTNPCGSTAMLVPLEELIPHRSGGYACSCLKSKAEQKLCFDDNQPGCPDSKIADLRWSLGFLPDECKDCQCMVTDSFDKVAWSSNFEKARGQRFIYPTEDLCADRGASLHLEASDREGRVVCGCNARASRCMCGDVFASSQCSSSSQFRALEDDGTSSTPCRCEVVTCPAPGEFVQNAGETKTIPGPDRLAGIENDSPEAWYLGDQVEWTCAKGYHIKNAGFVTRHAHQGATCQLPASGSASGQWSASPPECGHVNELLHRRMYEATKKGKDSSFKHPEGSGVVRHYRLEAEGTNIKLEAYKPQKSKPSAYRMTEDSPVPLHCKPNDINDGPMNGELVPDIGDSQVWLSGVVCRGEYHYNHNSKWKEPTHVRVDLVVAQTGDGDLVLAAREAWRVKDMDQAGPWMEVK